MKELIFLFRVSTVQRVAVEPSFKVVQLKTARIVLVMDVSWSMVSLSLKSRSVASPLRNLTVQISGNRLGHLRASTERWIRYELADASHLGLVEFS